MRWKGSWSALIFSAATSARRYTGPWAIRNGQAPVLCVLGKAYYDRKERRVWRSHQRPEVRLSL